MAAQQKREKAILFFKIIVRTSSARPATMRTISSPPPHSWRGSSILTRRSDLVLHRLLLEADRRELFGVLLHLVAKLLDLRLDRLGAIDRRQEVLQLGPCVHHSVKRYFVIIECCGRIPNLAKQHLGSRP